MTLRPLVAGLTIAFAALAPVAHAGLGGIRLLTGPGEPFYAEVTLDPEPGLENPFVALASRERYSTLAPYSDKAAQLQIRTVETAPNQYMVRITGPALSAGEVMNFALELSWPSGKVVREYRVNGGSSSPAKVPVKDDASAALAERHPLIDEPGGLAFGEARLLTALGLPLRAEIELLGDWPSSLAADSFQLSAFNDPALSAARIEVHQRKGRQWLTIRSDKALKAALLRFTLSSQQQDDQIRRDFTLRASQRGSYLSTPLPAVPTFKGSYKVQPGDTLSGLAYRFAGGKPVARVAREIYAANPQAFAQGNPDRLFAGSLLKVPEAGSDPANEPVQPAITAVPPVAGSVKPAPAIAPAQAAMPAKADQAAKAAGPAVSQPASAPQASVVQDASAAQAAALAQEKLAQLKAAQQRLAWLEAEINRLSSQASQPRVIQHRPDMDASAEQDEAFLDENLTQWVLYGVGGLSVASLLAWLLVKRRRASKPKVTVPSLGRAGMGPVTISASLGPDEQPLVQPIADDINLQTIDVLAEADVLMAYGRFDAAEQLLRESLSNEPEREDLRMKLLDLIARKGNKQEFESVALDLLAVFGPESALWKRVLQLGGSLDPDNPLYRPAPDQPEHFAMARPPAVDLGVFAPDSEDRVPLTSQVDNAEAAQDLARLYREMGDTETADALLREAGVKQ